MNTEEKALAYDEAIEQAKKELGTCGSQDCDAARQIFRLFPELKESEDGKIRKGLIDYFSGPINYFIPNIANEEVRAWLEKQGENKQILANSAKTCKIYPAEWSEEDEEELNKIIAHFDWTGNNRFTKDDCKRAQSWLKSLKPKNQWRPSNHAKTRNDAL